MPWVTGSKKWLLRSGACYACSGLFSNSAEMSGRIYRKNPDLGNLAIITYFTKIGLPRAAIYQVRQCIDTRKTAARKAESGRRAVQMPEKKRNQLVKTIWDKKGVTSMKLAEKMNADRSLVNRIVWEAAVKTYTGIRHSEFRPELEQRQKMDCGKDKGRIAHFEPHRRRDELSCCPVTSSYQGFLW